MRKRRDWTWCCTTSAATTCSGDGLRYAASRLCPAIADRGARCRRAPGAITPAFGAGMPVVAGGCDYAVAVSTRRHLIGRSRRQPAADTAAVLFACERFN